MNQQIEQPAFPLFIFAEEEHFDCPMNARANHVTSLDAGIPPQFHVERDWPGASELIRSPTFERPRMITKQTIVLFAAMLPLWLPAADSTNRLLFPVAGFSIAALEARPAPTPHMPLTMSLPATDNFSANVNVQIQPYEGSIEEYTALSLKQFKDFGLKVIEQKKIGKSGAAFQYSGKLQGRPLHWYARAEKLGGQVYLVTATAAEGYWADQASQLKGCVDSFRFEKREHDGPANGSQAIRSGTNSTSSAAGSRR